MHQRLMIASRLLRGTVRRFSSSSPNVYVWNEDRWPAELLTATTSSLSVTENFVTEMEEQKFLEEIEPHMRRLKYERTHWDDAIHLYREREQKNFSSENSEIIQRILDFSFPPDSGKIPFVHLLDLHEDGHIKPHIDATRYCGRIISGLSLLSNSVMRLRHKDEKDDLIVDLYLRRRSLYILRDVTRFDFTHEILPNNESQFGDLPIPKGRRIAVICREVAKGEEQTRQISFKTID